MPKRFNVTGACLPEYHYMVDISEKLEQIRTLVDSGAYFTINRARQYGKTTTLNALKHKLDKNYCVFCISFEGMEQEVFTTAESFCIRLFGLLYDTLRFGETSGISEEIKTELRQLSSSTDSRIDFRTFTDIIIRMCKTADKPVILMIDEVDQDYEADYHTGMNCAEIAALLYDYTSGYPFLVSRICQLIDERIFENGSFSDKSSTWTKDGFLAAVRILLTEENTLFDSLDNKLIDHPELKQTLKELLLRGKLVEYIPGNTGMRMALMFGFVKLSNGILSIANRIFETRLYNGFLAEESHSSDIVFGDKVIIEAVV